MQQAVVNLEGGVLLVNMFLLYVSFGCILHLDFHHVIADAGDNDCH